jgi:hypothetical protein
MSWRQGQHDRAPGVLRGGQALHDHRAWTKLGAPAYCKVGPETVAEFLAAPSLGMYYVKNIGAPSAQRGPFDCRDHPVPQF